MNGSRLRSSSIRFFNALRLRCSSIHFRIMAIIFIKLFNKKRAYASPFRIAVCLAKNNFHLIRLDSSVSSSSSDSTRIRFRLRAIESSNTTTSVSFQSSLSCRNRKSPRRAKITSLRLSFLLSWLLP
jgi:hypothetical protein